VVSLPAYFLGKQGVYDAMFLSELNETSYFPPDADFNWISSAWAKSRKWQETLHFGVRVKFFFATATVTEITHMNLSSEVSRSELLFSWINRCSMLASKSIFFLCRIQSFSS